MTLVNKMLIISIASVFMTGCGENAAQDNDSELSIVGGRAVTANDVFARHVVSLISKDGHNFCTGSLVGKQLVLTAAHCVSGTGPFMIGFGASTDTRSLSRANVREVDNIAINREYVDTEGLIEQGSLESKGKLVSDVAFIKIKTPAPQGFYPTKLIPSNWDFKVGSPVVLVGYGVTATPRPGVKIEQASDFFDHEKILGDHGSLRTVGSYYAGRNKIGEFVITSKSRKGVCSGDSGGPAFVMVRSPKSGKTLFYQVGIAARSNCYNSAWYTDVRAHADWIKRANKHVNGKS